MHFIKQCRNIFERGEHFNGDGSIYNIDDVLAFFGVMNEYGESIGDTTDIIIGELVTPKCAGLYIFTELFPKIDIQSDLDVDENHTPTGNITFGGTITLGSGAQDDVTFAADVASNIVPDVDNFYIFGRDTGLDSTTQRLGDTTVDDVTAQCSW